MATTTKPVDRLDIAIAQTERQLEELRGLRAEFTALRETAPELIGLTELAELLQTRLDSVSRLRRKGRIPPPIAELASGPVWLRAQFTWPNTLKEGK